MFRLIGVIVVIAVIFIGWKQINAVIDGDMSHEQASKEIRNKAADLIREKE
jgi:hypothetical protein